MDFYLWSSLIFTTYLVSGVGKMIYSLLRPLCLNAKHKRWWQSRYFLMQQRTELRHSKPSLQEVFGKKKKQSGIYQSFWFFLHNLGIFQKRCHANQILRFLDFWIYTQPLPTQPFFFSFLFAPFCSSRILTSIGFVMMLWHLLSVRALNKENTMQKKKKKTEGGGGSAKLTWCLLCSLLIKRDLKGPISSPLLLLFHLAFPSALLYSSPFVSLRK